MPEVIDTYASREVRHGDVLDDWVIIFVEGGGRISRDVQYWLLVGLDTEDVFSEYLGYFHKIARLEYLCVEP